jgi:hypothetical protein
VFRAISDSTISSEQILKRVPCELEPAVACVQNQVKRLNIPILGWDELLQQPCTMKALAHIAQQVTQNVLVLLSGLQSATLE